MVQQLAAGSLNFAINTGLVDPIRAIEKGAAAAIVRIEVQGPPYILIGRAGIKSMKELKGKTISLGGAKDITRIFVERMLAADGVKPGEFDMVFAGATSARFAALQSGAVDAAILAPPFSFRAEAAGFTNLGLTIDYVQGPAVRRHRGQPRPGRQPTGALVDKVLAVYNKSIAWFYDEREPRRGGEDDGGREQDAGRRRGEVLRLPDQRQIPRADRQGVESEARRAGRVRCSSSATFRTASTSSA